MVPETVALSPTMASRKLQALAFIELYCASKGCGPSLGEISAGIDCSRQRAHALVLKLAQEGRIHRTPGQPRSIRLITADEEAIRRCLAAGYILTDSGLLPPPDLDHIPALHGKENKSGRGQGQGLSA